MRKAPGIGYGIDYEFIPEVIDKTGWSNIKDPTPIKAMIKSPTERERREIYTAERWETEAVKRLVYNVQNYTDANGEPIASGSDLAEHGESEIVLAFAAEAATGMFLSEKEKKTSKQQSESCPIKKQGGIAKTAKKTS